MTDDAKIAETFNSFFGNIVNTLTIEKMRGSFVIRKMRLVLLLRTIKRHSKHPSILWIKQYLKNPTEFSFVPMDKKRYSKGN